MNYMQLIESIKERLQKEAKDLDELKLLYKENPKLAQLIADIDQIILNWALSELRNIKE